MDKMETLEKKLNPRRIDDLEEESATNKEQILNFISLSTKTEKNVAEIAKEVKILKETIAKGNSHEIKIDHKNLVKEIATKVTEEILRKQADSSNLLEIEGGGGHL